jgi:DNA-binding NtrC family response regulator
VSAQPGRAATWHEIENAYIVWLLEQTHGNRAAASKLLGVSYPTMKKRIADYGIDMKGDGRQPAVRLAALTIARC